MAYDPLWAPWRLGYILGDKNKTAGPYDADALLPGADPTCFFCQAVPSGDDRQRVVVQRGEHVIVLLNRYPYNNGHLLVAPKQHVARLDELGPEAELELSQTMTQIVGLLEKKLQPQGFNIGLNLGRAAGAGMPGHLHWHIVPRWTGDTNFMSSVAGINVIPQSLEALLDLLTTEN